MSETRCIPVADRDVRPLADEVVAEVREAEERRVRQRGVAPACVSRWNFARLDECSRG
jgi:hypothetical protein